MQSLSILQLRIITVGEWQENCYLLVHPDTNEGFLIDPGEEADRILAWAKDVTVRKIILTHAHQDHLGALNDVRAACNAPAGLHPADWEMAVHYGVTPDFELNDGESISLGGQELRVIHTPGHTPGSVCLRFGSRAIVGDAIFPGGPGHTNSPQELDLSLRSLQNTVFSWPDETELYPGHGSTTTVGRERQDFEAFIARPRPPDLYGDISWSPI
jgi:glyoxylase-like metal-dependent hydrolase (beta-lactamase superfamily II)